MSAYVSHGIVTLPDGRELTVSIDRVTVIPQPAPAGTASQDELFPPEPANNYND